MVKPILTVGVPMLSHEQHEEIIKTLKKTIDDYHIIVYTNNTNGEIIFEAFYEKDMSEIELEELKQLVTDSIKRGGEE